MGPGGSSLPNMGWRPNVGHFATVQLSISWLPIERWNQLPSTLLSWLKLLIDSLEYASARIAAQVLQQEHCLPQILLSLIDTIPGLRHGSVI